MKVAVVLALACLCAASALEVDTFEDDLVARQEENKHFGDIEVEKDSDVSEEDSEEIDAMGATKAPCLAKCAQDPCNAAKCTKIKGVKCVRNQCTCQARFYLGRFDVTRFCRYRKPRPTRRPTTAAPTTTGTPPVRIVHYDDEDVQEQREREDDMNTFGEDLFARDDDVKAFSDGFEDDDRFD